MERLIQNFFFLKKEIIVENGNSLWRIARKHWEEESYMQKFIKIIRK